MAGSDSFGDMFGGALGNLAKLGVSVLVTSGESIATMLGKKDVFQIIADNLLSTMDEHPVMHIVLVTASAALQYGKKTGTSLFEDLSQVQWLSALKGIDKMHANMDAQRAKTPDTIEKMMSALLDPNLEGIPLLSVSLTRTGDVEVPQAALLCASGSYRSQRQDNAVPKPLEWDIEAYLTSLSSMLDSGLSVKPTLAIQLRLLEAYRKSRKPLMFKDNQLRFYKVLLSHLEYTDTPENQNTVHIKLHLVEYCPITVFTDSLQSFLAYPDKSAQERKELADKQAAAEKQQKKLDEANKKNEDAQKELEDAQKGKENMDKRDAAGEEAKKAGEEADQADQELADAQNTERAMDEQYQAAEKECDIHPTPDNQRAKEQAAAQRDLARQHTADAKTKSDAAHTNYENKSNAYHQASEDYDRGPQYPGDKKMKELEKNAKKTQKDADKQQRSADAAAQAAADEEAA